MRSITIFLDLVTVERRRCTGLVIPISIIPAQASFPVPVRALATSLVPLFFVLAVITTIAAPRTTAASVPVIVAVTFAIPARAAGPAAPPTAWGAGAATPH